MIRKYTKKDKSVLIELLRQNTPQYFDPSEESEFEYYLDSEVEDYFVYENNTKIIGEETAFLDKENFLSLLNAICLWLIFSLKEKFISPKVFL